MPYYEVSFFNKLMSKKMLPHRVAFFLCRKKELVLAHLIHFSVEGVFELFVVVVDLQLVVF